MILGVHHPAVSVPDMDRALEFYCGLLGFEEVMSAGWPTGVQPMDDAMALDDSACRVVMVKKGNSCIELFEFTAETTQEATPDRPVSKRGLTHIAFGVSDFGEEYEKLKAAGVPFNGEPNGEAPGRWVYGRDPFGNVLELLEHDPDNASALSWDH